MRGKTYFYLAGNIAKAIAGTPAGSPMSPEDIGKRAADITDAVFAETTVRNAADLAAAEAALKADEHPEIDRQNALAANWFEGLNTLGDCKGA